MEMRSRGPVDEEALDLPLERQHTGQLEDDDSSDRSDGDDEHLPEPLEDERNSTKKLLSSRSLIVAPRSCDADNVGQKSHQHVVRETTEEDEHAGEPARVSSDQIPKAVRLSSVSRDDLSHVATDTKDKDDGDPNVEGRQESRQQHGVEPALDEEESNTERERAGDGVVREDVRASRELVVKRCFAPQEGSEEFGKGTTVRPLPDAVEDQLRAAERVLLPPVELVVAGKRYTFLESVVRVGGPPDDVALHEQAQSHVEVLGYVRFGPHLSDAVLFVDEGSLLHRRPSQESVVAHEGGDVSSGDSV